MVLCQGLSHYLRLCIDRWPMHGTSCPKSMLDIFPSDVGPKLVCLSDCPFSFSLYFISGADPHMVRIGTAPPFWQINHANSAYFRLFLGYFRVISATRPPLLDLSLPVLHILDPPLLYILCGISYQSLLSSVSIDYYGCCSDLRYLLL